MRASITSSSYSSSSGSSFSTLIEQVLDHLFQAGQLRPPQMLPSSCFLRHQQWSTQQLLASHHPPAKLVIEVLALTLRQSGHPPTPPCSLLRLQTLQPDCLSCLASLEDFHHR